MVRTRIKLGRSRIDAEVTRTRADAPEARIRDRLRVGNPDVHPSKPAHTKGIRAGNEPGSYEKQVGHNPDETSTAARSTGIRPERREPIDPRMPNISPP